MAGAVQHPPRARLYCSVTGRRKTCIENMRRVVYSALHCPSQLGNFMTALPQTLYFLAPHENLIVIYLQTNRLEMKPPRDPEDYRKAIIEYGSRSFTKTMLQGFIYRFLVELLREDDSILPKRFQDVDAYDLAHLSVYQAGRGSASYESSQFAFSGLKNLMDTPLPRKGQGHVLFMSGHLPGSWIASIGAKYGITPEFFRRHIHLWRSSEGPVLHNVPWMPSAISGKAMTLRINTLGYSQRPLGNVALMGRRKLLPEILEANPMRLAGAPGSSYVRGHAVLSDWQFIIEQDISITIESDGEGWTGK